MKPFTSDLFFNSVTKRKKNFCVTDHNENEIKYQVLNFH